MKVFKDDVVYVQMDDLGFLNSSDLSIPASICIKVFDGAVTIIDGRNRWSFIKFDILSEVDFFRGLDWIIDWDSVKDLSVEKLAELVQGILTERNSWAKSFNGMNLEDQTKNSDIPFKCTCLDHKISSLAAVINYKQGHLKMDLPGESESPAGLVPQPETAVMGPVISKGRRPRARWPFRNKSDEQ